MAPDFEYFLRLSPLATMGHSLMGLFVFCLPLGLLVLALYQLLIKRPLALLMPKWVFVRLGPVMQPQRLKACDAPVLAVLVLLGAASHLLWDGLTHGGGWAQQLWPIWGQVLFTLRGIDVPLFKLLQHVSSLVGLAALAWAATRWLGQQTESPDAKPWSVRRRWLTLGTMVAAATAIGLCAVLADWPMVQSARAAQVLIVRFVVASIAGLALSVLVFGVVVTLRS